MSDPSRRVVDALRFGVSSLTTWSADRDLTREEAAAEAGHVCRRIKALAGAEAAIDLRLARVLAWLRTQPLHLLGYPSWEVFLREHAPWAESWVRQLVRLVRSGLEEVIGAAARGELPLSVAVCAPANCAPATQGKWLAAALKGEYTRPKRKPSGVGATFEPDEKTALVLWHAREQARLIEGLDLTDREADEHMVTWWRARDKQAVVELAMKPAPRPQSLPGDHASAPHWSLSDGAGPILGPWRVPESLEAGVAELKRITRIREGRVLELGLLYHRVVGEGLHRSLGVRSVEALCRQLGVGQRTLQRHGELWRGARRLPELASSGLTLARMERVARVATPDDVQTWIEVAGRTPFVEFDRAVRHVETGSSADELLAAYVELMRGTTGAVALEAVLAPIPPRQTDRVTTDVVDAAIWLLTVKLPTPSGYAATKVAQRYICRNPECRRRARRNHSHHIDPQRLGGSHAPFNVPCLCGSCHTRIVHPGHAKVARGDGTHIWTYPGRRSVTVLLNTRTSRQR